MINILDARKLTDKESSHLYLKEQLDLPEYYGMNLDALYDCISEGEYHIAVLHVDEAGDYFEGVASVLDDACDVVYVNENDL